MCDHYSVKEGVFFTDQIQQKTMRDFGLDGSDLWFMKDAIFINNPQNLTCIPFEIAYDAVQGPMFHFWKKILAIVYKNEMNI